MSSPTRTRTARTAAALAVSLCVAAGWATSAQADSISYIKDGNVWLSSPDGARQFQVTTSGGYSDASQADDGTIIALHGVRLHKLDRLGTVLADFDTPVSDTRPAGQKVFWGPYEPAISPDGTRVAYHWYYTTTTQDPSCFPPACAVIIREAGTAYSLSDRQTGWDEPGLTKHSGWRNPTWADNSTLLLSDPSRMPNADVIIDAPGEREGHGFLVQNWFSDMIGGNPHMAGGDITRQQDKMAFVTGGADETLTLYGVPRFRPRMRDGQAIAEDRPLVCYRYGTPAGKFGTPTFSPDGGRMAYNDDAGIHVAAVPSFANGCTVDGATPSPPVVVPGATQPDWGPADVPAGRPATPQPGGGTPQGGKPQPGGGGPQGGGPQPGGGPAGGGARPSMALSRRVRLRTALRSGFAVEVRGAKAGARLMVVARYRGRLVARGRATASPAGSATVKLRFTAAGKARLKGVRRAALRLSGPAAVTVTLRR